MKRNPIWFIGLIYGSTGGVVLPLVAFYGAPIGTRFNVAFIIWLCVTGWAIVSGYCAWRVKKELDK